MTLIIGNACGLSSLRRFCLCAHALMHVTTSTRNLKSSARRITSSTSIHLANTMSGCPHRSLTNGTNGTNDGPCTACGATLRAADYLAAFEGKPTQRQQVESLLEGMLDAENNPGALAASPLLTMYAMAAAHVPELCGRRETVVMTLDGPLHFLANRVMEAMEANRKALQNRLLQTSKPALLLLFEMSLHQQMIVSRDQLTGLISALRQLLANNQTLRPTILCLITHLYTWKRV